MVMREVGKKLHQFAGGIVLALNSIASYGTNVYEKDWDILIILDTCRVDALKSVKSEYKYINAVDSITSVGSSSPEWIANTFNRNYLNKIQRTVHLTVNAHAHKILIERKSLSEYRDFKFTPEVWDTVHANDFQYFEGVWEHLPNNPRDRYHPENVTDRAISVYRQQEPDHMIVHYNQPHKPYLRRQFEDPNVELQPWEENPFEYLENGGEFSKVWKSYINELQYALDHIEILLENVDAEIVAISADHGEAFGELGMLYGHPLGVPHPALRKVPWVEATASNEETYEPQIEATKTEKIDIDEQLRFLGYRE
jgi:hypothetical protein